MTKFTKYRIYILGILILIAIYMIYKYWPNKTTSSITPKIINNLKNIKVI